MRLARWDKWFLPPFQGSGLEEADTRGFRPWLWTVAAQRLGGGE